MIDNRTTFKMKGDKDMLIAIIVLLFVMYEAKKEHEKILEKIERLERMEEEEKKKNIE